MEINVEIKVLIKPLIFDTCDYFCKQTKAI